MVLFSSVTLSHATSYWLLFPNEKTRIFWRKVVLVEVLVEYGELLSTLNCRKKKWKCRRQVHRKSSLEWKEKKTRVKRMKEEKDKKKEKEGKRKEEEGKKKRKALQ